MASTEEMHAEYVAQAAKNINFEFIPAMLSRPVDKTTNVPELHWEQDMSEFPSDDPRAMGYHIGKFHAKFVRKFSDVNKSHIELVLVFEENTFEGFLHPDYQVIINMETDAFTKYRVTYNPKTEKLELERLAENVTVELHSVAEMKRLLANIPDDYHIGVTIGGINLPCEVTGIKVNPKMKRVMLIYGTP
jgi:hypothetical protein